MASTQTRRKFQLVSWSGAALVLGIIAAGNFAISIFPVRIDTSAEQSYSISPATKQLLSKLEDRLVVRIAFSKDLPPVYKLNQRYVSDLLFEYQRASHGKIRVEYLDPSQSPKARERALSLGIIPVQLDVMERDRREVAEKFMGLSFSYGDKSDAIPFVQDVQSLEYEISVRIRKLIDPTKPVVALLMNGNALTLDSRSLDALAEPLREIYDVRVGDATDPIPENVKAVWWIAPSTPSAPAVQKNLNAYLARGGSVGVMVDQYDVNVSQFRAIPNSNGLEGLLDSWGLSIEKGFVVDPQCDRIQIRARQGSMQMVNVVDFPYFPVITAIDREHPATHAIDSFTMPFLSPVRIKGALPGLTYAPVAQTSPASYLDRRLFSLNPLEEPRRDPDAPAGPFNAAVVVQGKFNGGEKPGRLVVFGTSRLIRSEYPARQTNYALALNFVDWLSQDDLLVQIRARGFEKRPLRKLPDVVRVLLKYLMIVFLPMATLLMGLFVWRRQRSRRERTALEYGAVQ